MARRLTVREKISLVRELASRLGVSRACAELGVSRDSFYRWRRALKARGQAGLQARPRSFPTRQVAPDVEVAALALAAWYPKWGKTRVATELAQRDLVVSPTGVRNVWLRRHLATRRARVAYSRSMGPALHRLTRLERELFYGLPIFDLSPTAQGHHAPAKPTEDPGAPARIMDAEGRVLRVIQPKPKEDWATVKCQVCRKMFRGPPFKCPRCGAERGADRRWRASPRTTKPVSRRQRGRS